MSLSEREAALSEREAAQGYTQQYRKMISDTPVLLSLLYDADLLPEQIVTIRGAMSMAAVCIAYQEGLRATRPTTTTTEGGGMTEDAATTRYAKKQVRRMNEARDFPEGTCPSSRHVAMMAEALARSGKYHMLMEEPRHCAGSLASTVASLWQARAKLKELGYYNDGTGWATRPTTPTAEGTE